MNKKNQILEMFYNQHLKQVDISKKLNVSKAYVTKIIKLDDRYFSEKEKRKEDNIYNRKIYLYNYQKDYRAKKKEEELENFMKLQHEQASIELSSKPHISKINLRKFCSSIYDYDCKSNTFYINKNICTTNELPKKINMNNKILLKER